MLMKLLYVFAAHLHSNIDWSLLSALYFRLCTDTEQPVINPSKQLDKQGLEGGRGTAQVYLTVQCEGGKTIMFNKNDSELFCRSLASLSQEPQVTPPS